MMNEDISVYCRKLRLSRNFVNNSAVVEKSSPQEYLLEILRLECEYREKLKIERLIKTAGFYNRKRFCDFCFDEVKLPSDVTPVYLKEGRFIEDVKNLILYGNVGTGKTHLATAIGIEACNRGMKVGFYRTANLVNQLSDAKKAGNLSKLCETRFFRATGSQYREPLARGDQSQRRGAESHRSKHKYKEPPELRRRRLFVFNQLNVWKYCL